MGRVLAIVWWAAILQACAALPEWARPLPEAGQAATQRWGQYRFDWELSGEPAVAPLQVFDNGHQTWLQFLPSQALPAIFAYGDAGQRLLDYSRQGEYLILDGVWSELHFRGGHLRARAIKMTAPGAEATVAKTSVADAVPRGLPADVNEASSDDAVHAKTPVAAAEPNDLPVAIGVDDDGSPDVGVDAVALPVGAVTNVVSDETSSVDGSFSHSEPSPAAATSPVDQLDVGALTLESFTQASVPVLPTFNIGPDDRNLREALYRWAAQSGWTFSAEHWAVDVDIPVSGRAEFTRVFEDAVQDLLEATELADRPVRPCFYSNRVLRVVPYAQACDRSGGAGE